MADPNGSQGHAPEDAEEYNQLALLEDLETLLEEMEERGVVELAQSREVPGDIAERMKEAGVRDVQQLRDHIMRLHAELDEDERDTRISES